MSSHIFSEPTPGVIAHTAASRLLATDSSLAAWIGFNTEDIFPAAGAGVLPALHAHPEATSLTRAGFQFAFGTVDVEPMFATFGKDASRARRMGLAMSSLTGGEGYEVRWFVDACDLSEVDARGGTVVDVGGSHGFVCVDLARRWRRTRFVVQDLPKTVESAPVPVCEDDAQVGGRVEFMPHDFFTEQTVKADGESSFFPRTTQERSQTLTSVVKNSLLLPLDHAQLLDPLRRRDPQEPRAGAQARRAHHHQRPLPA